MAEQDNSAGFTPGPWSANGKGRDVYACGGQMKVCDIRGWGYLTGKGALALPDDQAIAIQTANESLIAAAPELYAALEALLPHVGTPVPLPDTAKLVRAAVAALAKARGEA
jgi:hypothetical protein